MKLCNFNSSNNTISKIKLWYNVYAIINNSLWIFFITIGFWIVLFKFDKNEEINPWFSVVYVILKLLIFVLM